MALYSYHCAACEEEVEEVRTIEQRDKKQKHEDCGGRLIRNEYPGCDFYVNPFVDICD